MTHTNHTALESFIATKTRIDEMLVRLTLLSNDHFDAHPDAITWGHVGTINQYAAALRQITDSAFGEGDHTA